MNVFEEKKNNYKKEGRKIIDFIFDYDLYDNFSE